MKASPKAPFAHGLSHNTQTAVINRIWSDVIINMERKQRCLVFFLLHINHIYNSHHSNHTCPEMCGWQQHCLFPESFSWSCCGSIRGVHFSETTSKHDLFDRSSRESCTSKECVASDGGYGRFLSELKELHAHASRLISPIYPGRPLCGPEVSSRGHQPSACRSAIRREARQVEQGEALSTGWRHCSTHQQTGCGKADRFPFELEAEA